MPDSEPPATPPQIRTPPTARDRPRSRSTIVAAVFAFLVSSLGFALLLALMEQRPQFVGQGLAPPRRSLFQGAPNVVLRKVADDVSAYERVHPDRSAVRFDMKERPDHRGLKTVHSMTGVFRGEYTIENPFDEPVFVLFRCGHPRSTDSGENYVRTTGVSFETTSEGQRVDAPDAWLWTGELAAGEVQMITLRYDVPRVSSVGYHVPGVPRLPMRELEVAIALDSLPPMVFTSREGVLTPDGAAAVWERRDLLSGDTFRGRITEDRSLFGALRQLLEVGPLVTGLFLAATTAFLSSRRKLTPVQVLTIAAAYGFYFPLLLYLAANFRFAWALPVAFAVPGVLLLNYARLLVGTRAGVLGGLFFLGVFQVFPTLTAFAGWNRGLVLLSVGTVTLFVLIDLQNRHLRAALIALVVVLLVPREVRAQDAWVARRMETSDIDREEPTDPLVSLGIADYRMNLMDRFIDVRATIPAEVLRPGSGVVPLFAEGLYLVDADLPDFLRLTRAEAGIAVIAVDAGVGQVDLSYRVPLQLTGERIAASIPLARSPSGRVDFEARQTGIEFLDASLWSTTRADDRTHYTLGTSGTDALRIGWSGAPETVPDTAAEETDQADLYGIGIASADHLTVLDSDCTGLLFAVYRLPRSWPTPFELELPPNARVISVTVDGLEVEPPSIVEGVCAIRLDARGEPRGVREVALRLDLGRYELGFLGTLELVLPKTAFTTGRLSWAIALPDGFDAQVRASGLDVGEHGDLASFGPYGEILRARRPLSLGKTLVPARAVRCELHYRQVLPGLTD